MDGAEADLKGQEAVVSVAMTVQQVRANYSQRYPGAVFRGVFPMLPFEPIKRTPFPGQRKGEEGHMSRPLRNVLA